MNELTKQDLNAIINMLGHYRDTMYQSEILYTNERIDELMGKLNRMMKVAKNPACPNCETELNPPLVGEQKGKAVDVFRCPKCQKAYSPNPPKTVDDLKKDILERLWLDDSAKELEPDKVIASADHVHGVKLDPELYAIISKYSKEFKFGPRYQTELKILFDGKIPSYTTIVSYKRLMEVLKDFEFISRSIGKIEGTEVDLDRSIQVTVYESEKDPQFHTGSSYAGIRPMKFTIPKYGDIIIAPRIEND